MDFGVSSSTPSMAACHRILATGIDAGNRGRTSLAVCRDDASEGSASPAWFRSVSSLMASAAWATVMSTLNARASYRITLLRNSRVVIGRKARSRRARRAAQDRRSMSKQRCGQCGARTSHRQLLQLITSAGSRHPEPGPTVKASH